LKVEVVEKEKIIKVKEEKIKLKGDFGIIRITEETFENGILVKKETAQKYLEANKVENGEIQLFDKRIREIHRTKNIGNLKDTSEEYKLFKKHFQPDFDEFVELGNSWEEKYEFLINKIFYSGQLFDLEENELPRAMTFDYMKGSVSNKNFNLGKLIIFLRTLEQVELLGEKKIEEIPWYNTSKGENEHISFKIIPTISDWEQIKMTEIKYGTCTESDKLLEKFLEFYGINEFRKEKDE
jgi:hypothetical protein